MFFQVGKHGFCGPLKLVSMDKVFLFFHDSVGLLALGGFLFNIKRETVFHSWRPNQFKLVVSQSPIDFEHKPHNRAHVLALMFLLFTPNWSKKVLYQTTLMDTRNSFSLQPPSPFTKFFINDPRDQMNNASGSEDDSNSDCDDEDKDDGSSDSDGGDSDDGNHRWHSTGTHSS